jgi:hypothetical protein
VPARQISLVGTQHAAYTPEKSFGTILVGIGFASYLVPVLRPEVKVAASHKDKSHVKYTTS